jgi:hypothetical protein
LKFWWISHKIGGDDEILNGAMTRKKRRKLRWLKWPLAILLCMALLVLLAQLFVALYGEALLTRYLQKWAQSTGGVYRIHIERGDVNLLKSRLKVTGFHIRPTAEALEKMKRGQSRHKRLMDLYMPTIKIEGVDIFKILLKRELNIGHVFIRDGKFKVLGGEGTAVPKLDPPGQPGTPGIPALKSFRIDTLALDNCSFQMVRAASGTPGRPLSDFSFHLKDLNIRLLRVPPGKGAAASFDWHHMVLTVRDLNWLLPDRMYRLKCGQLTLHGGQSRLHLRQVEWQPLYQKHQFSRQRGYQTDRVHLLIPELSLTGLRLPPSMDKHRLCCTTLDIDSPELTIFRDRRLPRRSDPLPKKLPQQLLGDLNVTVNIKTVNIINGFISYEEHPRDSTSSGQIFFDQLEGQIQNVTNDRVLPDRKTRLSLRLSTRLMGRSPFRIHMNMPLKHRYNYFTFGGSLDRVVLPDLNPVLMPLTRLRIEKGVVESLGFFGMANEDYAEGTVRLFYHDLKVSVLDKKIPHRKKKLRSFILNQIIRSQNPGGNRTFRVGKMYWRRKKSQSFINYLWKTLITGLKSSVGLKK